MVGILISFGVVLACLGLVVGKIAPAVERVAFITGLVGGGLSVLWGIATLAGMKGRKWPILTVIGTIVVLLTRAVHVWTTSSAAAGGTAVRLVVTLMFFMTMGVLLYLFHGERPPEFYERGRVRHDAPFSGHDEKQSQIGRVR